MTVVLRSKLTPLQFFDLYDNEFMIMNLYSAKSIGEYSKALYIELKNKKKLKFENS